MLELTVQAYNVNDGKNEKLMEACKVLREYAQYVSRVRSYAGKMPLKEALERSVDECIKEGILRDFLSKNRAEALEMSWYEYNEELHLKNEREYAFEQGIKQEHQRAEQKINQVQEQYQQEIMRMQSEIERLKQQLKAGE